MKCANAYTGMILWLALLFRDRQDIVVSTSVSWQTRYCIWHSCYVIDTIL